MLKYFLSIFLSCAVLISSKGANAQFEVIRPPPGGLAPLGPGPTLYSPPADLRPGPSFDLGPGPTNFAVPGPTIGPLGPGPIASPPGGGPGPGGDGSGPPIVRAIVISVCVYDTDYNDGCWQKSWEDAVKQLTANYMVAVRDEVIKNALELRFPAAIAATDQLRFISKLEGTVVKVVAAQLRNNVRTITPFYWRDEDTRQINQWEAQATSRAATGSNWRHDWQSNTHTVRLGNAYAQALSINLHGEWKNQ
jgi:hypothetical protein